MSLQKLQLFFFYEHPPLWEKWWCMLCCVILHCSHSSITIDHLICERNCISFVIFFNKLSKLWYTLFIKNYISINTQYCSIFPKSCNDIFPMCNWVRQGNQSEVTTYNLLFLTIGGILFQFYRDKSSATQTL